MPVKPMVVVLAWASVIVLALETPTNARAFPFESIHSFAPTIVPTASVVIKKGGARYRVVRSHPRNLPRDFFRIKITGMEFEQGDRVAFSFAGVPLGDITQGEGLTLDSRLRARGTIGLPPNTFFKARIFVNKKRRRMTFMAGRGTAATGDIPFQVSGIPAPYNSHIMCFIDVGPPDGVVDVTAVIPVTFTIRGRVLGNGTFIERGRSN